MMSPAMAWIAQSRNKYGNGPSLTRCGKSHVSIAPLEVPHVPSTNVKVANVHVLRLF